MLSRRTFVTAAGLAAASPFASTNSAQAAPPVQATPQATSATTFKVEGYLQAWSADSLDIAEQSTRALTTLGISGATLIDGGARLEDPSQYADDVSDIAHTNNAQTEFLFTNYSPDGFSSDLLDGLLLSATNRQRVIGQLVSWIRTLDLDGIQIDLESMSARHGEPLVTFVRELRAALPTQKGLTMAVMASSSPAQYVSRGYLFQKLNASISGYVLMTYAQSGPWSAPGALGGIPYTTKSLDAAKAAGIPTGKLHMGIGAQGYAWHPDGTVVKVSPREARALASSSAAAGTSPVYDPTEREMTVTLKDGTVIWWSDARAVNERKQLAQNLGLPGVAIWSLNTADPLT